MSANTTSNRLIESFLDTRRISQTELLDNSIMIRNASKIYPAGFCSDNSELKGEEHNIFVLSNTPFSVAKQYVLEGKVAVLNFANPVNPGGGVINGAMAQEECLCRSSNLYEALVSEKSSEFYQYHKNLNNTFYSDRLIYTPGVTVFKDDSDIPRMLTKNMQFKVDVITCAAPYLGNRKYTNKTALKILFVNRIKNIMESALDNNIDILILGAFGCGAFKNPSYVVAEAFKVAIETNQYDRKFKKLIFAIKPDKDNLWSNNFRVFNKTFNYVFTENCPIFHLPEISMPTGDKIESCTVEFSSLPSDTSIEEVKDLIAKGDGTAQLGLEQKHFEKQAKFLKWQRSNPYYKKQFSILGDSISTLNGYNPKEYNLFYFGDNCKKTSVNDMSDTWWGQVINYFGGELLVNNSWSGSRVTQLPNTNTLFPSGCSDERTSKLHINTVGPDVIIVYLGTNDWGNGVEVEYDAYLGEELTPQHREFYSCYLEMIKKLKKNYPNAEIWCCTLNTTFMSSNSKFEFPYRFKGVHIEQYNETIRNIARNENCKLIDLYSYHLPYDTIDGSHPNKTGMNILATIMIRSILGQETTSFLDCHANEHNFVVRDEFTGGTKYVCSKCCFLKTENTLFELNASKGYDSEMIYNNEEYVMLPPETTTMLYSDTLRVTNELTGKDVLIQANMVTVGRDSKNDVVLNANPISRNHATFFYENNSWFIRDDNSKNGVWLNGKKMIPNKKYQLAADYKIDFAHAVTLTFNKIKKSPISIESEAKAISVLEASIEAFAKSEYKDQAAWKLILASMTKAPLIVPVELDSQNLLSGIDPYKLKKGDVISTQTDIKGKILSIKFDNGVEMLPLFTSSSEAKKGPLSSSIKEYPVNLVKIMLQKGLPIIINPFSDYRFVLEIDTVKKILIPIIEQQNPENKSNIIISKREFVTRTINGKYKVEQQIGKGGNSEVYLGCEIATGKKVAIKRIIRTTGMPYDISKNAALQETLIMARFNHPSIPKVYDIIETNDSISIIKEYLEGKTLDQLLNINGAQPINRVMKWAKNLAEVLLYIHSFNPPYIHRDIKPQNILITKEDKLVLFDFDIAIPYEKGKEIDINLGTKGYAAPEQYGGTIGCDTRADFFGFGATLHYLLTGNNPGIPPYSLNPITNYNSKLPKGLEYIVTKCTQLNPNDRYQSAIELLEDLKNYEHLPKISGFMKKIFSK